MFIIKVLPLKFFWWNKNLIVKLFIISLVFSLTISLMINIPVFMEKNIENQYPTSEYPDLIIDTTYILKAVINTSDNWDGFFNNIESMESDIEIFGKLTVFTSFVLFAKPLYYDISNKYSVGYNSEVNLVVVSNSYFNATKLNLNIINEKSNETNYIFINNYNQQLYAPNHNSITIRGVTRNTSINIDYISSISWTNAKPRTIKNFPLTQINNFPYFVTKNFNMPILITSTDNFLELLSDLGAFSTIKTRLEYQINFNYQSEFNPTRLTQFATADISRIKNTILNYISSESEIPNNFNLITPIFFEISLIDYKLANVRELNTQYTLINMFFFIIAVIILFETLKLLINEFNKFSTWSKAETFFKLNGSPYNVLQLNKSLILFFGAGLGLFISGILVLNEINQKFVNIDWIFFIFIFSFIILLVLLLLIYYTRKSPSFIGKSNSNISSLLERDNLNSRNFFQKYSVLIIIPLLVSLISIQKNFIPYGNAMPGFYLIFIQAAMIFTIFYAIKKFDNMYFNSITIGEIILKFLTKKKYFYLPMRSISRLFIINKTKSIINIMIIVLLVSTLYIYDLEETKLRAEERNSIGADFEINYNYRDLVDPATFSFKSQILNEIGENVIISPYIQFTAKGVLLETNSLSVNANELKVLLINFSILPLFEKYSPKPMNINKQLVNQSNGVLIDSLLNDELNNPLNIIYTSSKLVMQYENVPYLNLTNIGTYDIAPRITGPNPTLDRSIIMNFNYSYNYVLNSTFRPLLPPEDFESGFLMWLKDDTESSYLSVIEKLNELEISFNTINKSIYNKIDSFRDYLSTIIVLFLIIFVVMLSINQSRNLKDLKEITNSMIKSNYSVNLTKAILMYTFICLMIFSIIFAIILSIGVSFFYFTLISLYNQLRYEFWFYNVNYFTNDIILLILLITIINLLINYFQMRFIKHEFI